MANTVTQNEVTSIKYTMSSSNPTDVTAEADAILTQALDFCAQKLNLSSSEAVVENLRQGDSSTYRYWTYGLAKKASEQLGAWDESIIGIYIYDYEATPEDVCFSEVAPDPLIHLIIWAQRKTAALKSLMEALDNALTQAHIERLGTHHLKYVLDVQVVDDYDVASRRGYGALFSSLHHRPLPVWRR